LDVITTPVGNRFVGWTRPRARREKKKLEHASGEAERFYRQQPAPVLIGMESTGNCQWFVELAATLGHDLWIGDAAKIRASDVRAQKTRSPGCELILKLLLEGRFHESGHVW